MPPKTVKSQASTGVIESMAHHRTDAYVSMQRNLRLFKTYLLVHNQRTMTQTSPPPPPVLPAATAGEVLALIRSGQAATRGALGRATGLSRTAVNARLSALADAGLVLEGEEESATGGRPATTLVLNSDGRAWSSGSPWGAAARSSRCARWTAPSSRP